MTRIQQPNLVKGIIGSRKKSLNKPKQKENSLDLFKKESKPNLKNISKKNTQTKTPLEYSEKEALSATYETFIKEQLLINGNMENNIQNIIQDLPLTNDIVQYTKSNTELIPISSIVLSVISKYSHYNSTFRIGVKFNNSITTPNLFTFVVLKSGYNKDKTIGVINTCFKLVNRDNYTYKSELYNSINNYIKAHSSEENPCTIYQPNIPDDEFSMTSTAEGFQSSHLDMNSVNYGALQVKSGEFFDSIINSKSSTDLIEKIKDTYYFGSRIGKTIKSREFKSPSTFSYGICASFHSAMELNDFNKDKVIDFAKNGLGRRLLISMSSDYRFKYNTFETDIDYSQELLNIQESLEMINHKHQKEHKTITVDYETAIVHEQQYSRVLNFTEEAQIFLITLKNHYMNMLEYNNDQGFIVVAEQVIKIALNLHLIEYNNRLIQLETVQTAFKLFLIFHLSKQNYENKLFGQDIEEVVELLQKHKLGKTELFGMKYLKKTRWGKKQRDTFLLEVEEYCDDNKLEFVLTKDGNKTLFSIEKIQEIKI